MSDDNDITVLPPPLFNYDADDLLGEWKQWFQKLEEYLIAYDQADSPDEGKIRVLLNHLGNEGREIYESLEDKDNPGERIKSFAALTEALAVYFESSKNVLFERFKFFKIKRKPGQPAVDFVNDLTKAASCCEFTEKENIIRDKLMEQLKDKSLIERLLVEGGSLTLERAVKICHKWENRKGQANENKPPGPGNDPEPPKGSADSRGSKKRETKPVQLTEYPVVTILGVVPELMNVSPKSEETNFWDDSRDYSDQEEETVRRKTGPHGSMCDVCGKICQGPAALRYHMEVHSGKKPYACTKCDYRGTLYASLQSHMRVHESCKFKCDQCDFKARRSYGLKVHKRINHTGERPFACEFCDKRYADRGALNFHVRSRHTALADGKPKPERAQWNYSCETCGRKFVLEDRFKRHIAAHKVTSVTGYQCYACSFKTDSRNSIIRHLNNRHGEKNYSCSQCDYKTAMKSDFNDHQTRHSGTRPFMCDVCGFSAASRSTMTSHKRVHSEKNITCDFCDYKTCRRQSMKAHMRRHTGERPFECSLCGYKAAQRGTLTKHIEVIHNKESKKSKPASRTASNVDSGQSVRSTQNNSQEVYPTQNHTNVNISYNLNPPLQHQNYNNPPLHPATPPVYLAQNNYYPNAAYYHNNPNVEIVHNNSPFDLDQFVRSNMIN